MLTEFGAGQTAVKDFAVDFGEKHIYIGRKTYPKGYFANAVLNIGKEEMTNLLIVTAPIFHAWQDIMEYGYSMERFENGRAAVLKLKDLLFKMEPFCLLDLEAEQSRLDFLLSDDAKQFLHDHWELLRQKDAAGGLMKIQFTEEESDTNSKGLALLQMYTDLLNFYRYIPHDLTNFATAILNFENQKLRELEKRNADTLALAADEFFSDPWLPVLLHASQITRAVAGFSLCANTRQEFVVLNHSRSIDARGEILWTMSGCLKFKYFGTKSHILWNGMLCFCENKM